MTADQRRAGLADLTRLDEEMRAPAEAHQETPRQRVTRWAEQHGIRFVSRSYGQYSTDTISLDALETLAALPAAHVQPKWMPGGWRLTVTEDESESWLRVTGPGGQEIAFSAERGSVRAQVMQELAIAQAPAVGATSSLDPDEGDAVTLWAEIHRLRAAVQGPDGYASWQDAATAERMRRVAGVKVMRQALEALETCMGVPHWPSLTPTVAALRAAISQPPVQHKEGA